jgi:SAM-dependent methyltransferase
VLSRLPIGYGVWQRLGLFRHGEMDSGAYALEVFRAHLERAGWRDAISGKTVLELGPGDSLATALIAAAHGAKAVLVDTGAYAREDMRGYESIAQKLRTAGLRCPDIAACKDTNELLEACGARYLTDGLTSLKSLPASCVDLIFSQAVLEHVRRRQFLETMRECRRLLVSGGAFSNVVDLQDHLGGALDNLRFSERVWESDFLAKSGFYTNRIQYSEMLSHFLAAGFRVESVKSRSWPALPTPRHKLSDEFRALPDRELLISGFDILLR